MVLPLWSWWSQPERSVTLLENRHWQHKNSIWGSSTLIIVPFQTGVERFIVKLIEKYQLIK